MLCKNCGASILKGSAFCTACGHRVTEDCTQQIQYQQGPKDNRQAESVRQHPPQPGYFPTYGGTAPIVSAPNKPQKIGLIVLVCALSVIAIAAIVFVYLKVFSPSKAEPENFADVYESLLQSSVVSGTDQLEPTQPPVPSPTPAPTEAILDLPFDFVQLSYYDVSHTIQTFNNIEEFELALISTVWTYLEPQGNPNATSFNGGYVDIGNKDPSVISKYSFSLDYSLVYSELSAIDYCVLNEMSHTYWTQDIGGTYAACWDTGIQTAYNGAIYDAVIMLIIDVDGNLVEGLALFDPYTDDIVQISSYNVYVPQSASVFETSDHDPMEWKSQKEFETTLTSCMWVYVRTDEAKREIIVDEYSDITPNYFYKLILSPDGTVECICSDYNTMEIIENYIFNYIFGNNHAYIYIEPYKYNDNTYEVNLYYYIDYNGYLIEQVMLYEGNSGNYYLISNVNVYESAGL
ncbi:MAG: zinc-ribbon domain-containing protein [Christensenellales bacterium]|jgi:hypothetical protein